MLMGAICLSHSPLLEKNRADHEVEARFNAALRAATKTIAAWEPDLVIVFYPDHFNGFFYDLMPPFCIGVVANSVGDYGSVPGPLDVPEDLALSMAQSCIADGVDVAVSYRMQVDHGAVQPVELLSGAYPLNRVIPVFINCAAPPRPRFARVRALGEAVGRWAAKTDLRIAALASGGLSHDPPLPAIAGASPEVRARLIDGRNTSYMARLARQNRVFNAGHEYVAGTSPLLPLNPQWDMAFLEALRQGCLTVADDWTDDEITAAGGRGFHEVRSWIAALSALSAQGASQVSVDFYEPVKEWITGMAVLSAEPKRASSAAAA